MINNDFLSDLDGIGNDVANGVIVATVDWKVMSGRCKLKDFTIHSKNGKNSFWFLLENEEGNTNKFLKIPLASDTNSSKAYCWTAIFNVIYQGLGIKDKKVPASKVLEELNNVLDKHEYILCDYKQVKNSFLSKGGEQIERVNLESLVFVENGPEREGERPLQNREPSYDEEVPF